MLHVEVFQKGLPALASGFQLVHGNACAVGAAGGLERVLTSATIGDSMIHCISLPENVHRVPCNVFVPG